MKHKNSTRFLGNWFRFASNYIGLLSNDLLYNNMCIDYNWAKLTNFVTLNLVIK